MSTPITTEELDLDKLTELEKAATPGPWTAESAYTNREEETQEFIHAEAVDGSLFDTLNSDARLIESEHDESSCYWDATGRANMTFVAAIRNAAPALIAAARELATLKALLAEAKGADISVGIDLKPITPPGVLP